MVSRLRILSVILCGALSLSVFAGCESDDNKVSSEESKSESTTQEEKVVEYETVEPPEGGWTTEEIMNVTYLCDHKLSYPLSIEYLGEDFSLSRYSRRSAKQRIVPAVLSYKGDIKLVNSRLMSLRQATLISICVDTLTRSRIFLSQWS